MSRSRAWCFTWNNPCVEARNIIDSIDVKYRMYQLETGESGTPHLQGVLVFKNARIFKSVKSLLPECHLEPTKSVSASIAYCSKEDGRLDGPWEHGDRPEQGKRTDLAAACDRILSGESIADISTDEPALVVRNHRGLQFLAMLHSKQRKWEMDVQVFWGPTGTGKTRKAFEEAPDAFWKEKGDWWDGYVDQEDVIWDEFACDVPITFLLRVLDRYPMRVPFKGGFVNFVAKRIFITSNIPFEEWYQGAKQEHRDALRRRITKVTHFNAPLME
ncbi:MAG: helicase [Circoviridae sp.]|nr:MAG: helicase [Circoviridae sp.]